MSCVKNELYSFHDKHAPSTEHELWHQDHEAHVHEVQQRHQGVYQVLKTIWYIVQFINDCIFIDQEVRGVCSRTEKSRGFGAPKTGAKLPERREFVRQEGVCQEVRPSSVLFSTTITA